PRVDWDWGIHSLHWARSPCLIWVDDSVSLSHLRFGEGIEYTNLFTPYAAGERVALPGIETTIKVTSASTGGAFAIFEEVTSPGAGPALHVHAHQFEIFRFLEGIYEVKVGDSLFTAEPGAVAVVAPGSTHRSEER